MSTYLARRERNREVRAAADCQRLGWAPSETRPSSQESAPRRRLMGMCVIRLGVNHGLWDRSAPSVHHCPWSVQLVRGSVGVHDVGWDASAVGDVIAVGASPLAHGFGVATA